MQRSDCFVWIDLEMTGLDPQKDVILEIATIITDTQLNIIAKGPEFVIHQSPEALRGMDTWVEELHTKSGLLEDVAQSPISLQHAEHKTVEFIKQYCERGTASLAGNSVWSDRNFLARYMPSLITYLHYRIVDVSTIKVLVNNWYPGDPGLHVVKGDNHRALVDIQESIAELKKYRNHFFKQKE